MQSRIICSCLCTLRKSYSKKPTSNSYIKLCEIENKLRSDLSKEKVAYETKLVNDVAGEKNLLIYRYMKNIRSTHDIPTSMYLDDVKATSDLDKASLFNRYLHSVFSKSNSASPNDNTNLSSPSIHYID